MASFALTKSITSFPFHFMGKLILMPRMRSAARPRPNPRGPSCTQGSGHIHIQHSSRYKIPTDWYTHASRPHLNMDMASGVPGERSLLSRYSSSPSSPRKVLQ